MLSHCPGDYDFSINQYSMDEKYLPFVYFSQPSKPGKLTVITKNQHKSTRISSLFLIDAVFSVEAILVVAAIGFISVFAAVVITRIQRTTFTTHMAWDVIYG